MNTQELNTAIYNEVAKAAAEAFEFLRIAPGKYTPAQIVAAMKKKAASWNDDPADRLKDLINISIESFSCSFPLCGSFDLLARMATAYEVPTKARVTFERAAEELPALLSLEVPAAAREVAKAVSKKDTLRPTLTFSYFDIERRALVGTNGQLITICAAPSFELFPGAENRKGFLIAPALLRSKKIKVDEINATDGHSVAESPALRFPNWAAVFPELHDTDALFFDKTTAAAIRKAVADATKYADAESGPNGFVKYVGIFGEAYTNNIIIRSRRNVAENYIYNDTVIKTQSNLTRSFALAVNGEAFAGVPAFNALYVPANNRPAVAVGAGVVTLIFALTLPDGFTAVCKTDAAPAWSKVVNPVADLLAETTQAPAETIAEPETVAEPEAVADPETVAEPEAVAEPETVADPETVAEPEAIAEPEAQPEPAAPAAVVVVDRDELPTPDGLTISTPRPRAEVLRAPRRPWQVRRYLRRALQTAAALLALLLLAIAPDRITTTTAAPAGVAELAEPAPVVPSVRQHWHIDLIEPDEPAEAIAEPAEAVELREVVVLPQHNKKRAHSAAKSTTAAPAEVIATPEAQPEPAEAIAEPETVAEPTQAPAEAIAEPEAPAEVIAESEAIAEPEAVAESAQVDKSTTTAEAPAATSTPAASVAPVLVAAGVPAVAIPYIIACF